MLCGKYISFLTFSLVSPFLCFLYFSHLIRLHPCGKTDIGNWVCVLIPATFTRGRYVFDPNWTTHQNILNISHCGNDILTAINTGSYGLKSINIKKYFLNVSNIFVLMCIRFWYMLNMRTIKMEPILALELKNILLAIWKIIRIFSVDFMERKV